MAKTATLKREREQVHFDPDGLRDLLQPDEEPAPVDFVAYATRASEIIIKAMSKRRAG